MGHAYHHIRSLLDGVAPSAVHPMFSFVFQGLQQAGVVDRYRSMGQTLLLALDGTRYFSSQNVHCSNCSSQRHTWPGDLLPHGAHARAGQARRG